MTRTDAFTRFATTSAGTPWLRCQVIDPVRTWWGLREDGNIGAVVVRDRARLSRDFDERLRLRTYFRETGAELHVVEADGHVDGQDIQTSAMECVHAAMDHIKKMAEIERSRAAVRERLERGDDHGRPPYGLRFDDEGRRWIPDRDSGEFDAALAVICARESGGSWREVAEETGVNRSTARGVWKRRERYLEHAEAEAP